VPNYTYPGTQTVKNKFGTSDEGVLARLEGAFVEARQTEITLRYGPKGRFDVAHLKSLHQHLFQDVYEWAGRTRDERVNLSDGTVASQSILRKLGGKNFLIARLIPRALDRIAKSIRDADYLRGLVRQEFAERAADIMAALNSIHPFREGNGRAQRAFMMELAREAGHKLDFSVVS
jgi:cell filamentation protein